jgi:Ca2+-binding RTX toxin-like protein
VTPVGFVVILVAGLVGLVGPAGARPGAVGPRLVEIGTDHARIVAVASNGSDRGRTGLRPSAIPVEVEASDFSVFSEAVSASDDSSDDRDAQAQASQDTTVDDTGDELKVESVGSAIASGSDENPAAGAGPNADATSEFSITFEVTEFAESFSLDGEISATADPSSAVCATVTVTSPTGAVFDVAAPSGCGAPGGQSIQDAGRLQPGTYTFSVVANAPLANPDAAGGVADASFDIDLGVGCGIIGTEGDDNLVGTAGDDFICGLGGDDTLDGSGGDDVIFGGGGSDLITGGEGDDVIAGQGGEDANLSVFAGLFGGPGDDLIDGGEGSSLIEGGTGNDILSGGSDFDFIFGDDSQGCDGALSDPGLNDDEILGGGGDDLLKGCQGLDKIFGEGGDDAINGNTGNDVLRGDAGSDKLHGNAGSDKLTGGTRRDVLFGDGANDTLVANDGVLDIVHGGPGRNDNARLDVVDVVDGVEIALVG